MERKKHIPPELAEKLLRVILPDDETEALIGDFREIYKKLLAENRLNFARLWYWFQVIKFLPSFVANIIYWRIDMLGNYLKIASRNLLKHRGYSFINIAGLAIGMACCILILLWVQDELSYDRFHENLNELCRVVQEQHYTDGTIFPVAVTPEPLGPALKKDYPEITDYTRFRIIDRALISYKGNSFYEEGFGFADPSFFEMFTLPFVGGDPEKALSALNSVVITEQMAEKYFGDEEPVGKVLTLNSERDFMVSGVIKNVPNNSHFHFDFLGKFEYILKELKWGDGWWNNSFYTYVLLQKNARLDEINSKIYEYIKKIAPDSRAKFLLQPVKDIHLYSSFRIDLYGPTGDKSAYIYIFSLIALFILFIACINFMNLTTARSGSRAKEIGLRKVAGAYRTNIITQFFTESVLLSIIAFIIALLLVLFFLPFFNDLSGKQISPDFYLNIKIVVGLTGIALLTGIIAGSYPALMLSSFHPVKVLKGALKGGAKGSLFRKVLVVTQFSLSIILIIGTITVNKQLDYIQNRKLGYEKDYVLYFGNEGELKEKYDLFKNELLKDPKVKGVTVSSALPTITVSSTSGFSWEGSTPEDNVLMHTYSVDHDFIKTFAMEIIEGRDFSKKITTDETEAYIINEAAAKQMRLESPVGKRFTLQANEGRIIGVVKNFHFKSLHNEIESLLLRIEPRWFKYIFVRLDSEDIFKTIQSIEKVHQEFNPGYPFEFSFLDESIDKLYKAEQQIGVIIQYFTILAIFISCLGLFGLASYMAEQRTKEIGVRKVLGATVQNIVLLLSQEFIKWVLIANIIAWPAAWYVMNRWLQGFAFRTNIGIWIFVVSAALAFVIALFTVSFQSIKASYANPVKSLKYE